MAKLTYNVGVGIFRFIIDPSSAQAFSTICVYCVFVMLWPILQDSVFILRIFCKICTDSASNRVKIGRFCTKFSYNLCFLSYLNIKIYDSALIMKCQILRFCQCCLHCRRFQSLYKPMLWRKFLFFTYKPTGL